MKNFGYKVSIPTDKEYVQLLDVTEGENAVIHWALMFSWVDNPKLDPELIAKNPDYRALRGYSYDRCDGYALAPLRYVHIGFRPTFKPLNNDALPADIADGDIVTIGTLYMDGKPVRIPKKPIYNGDIEDYIPGATLEFRPVESPTYQVRAIKCGNVFVCDRCLLKGISYNDICASFPNNN